MQLRVAHLQEVIQELWSFLPDEVQSPVWLAREGIFNQEAKAPVLLDSATASNGGTDEGPGTTSLDGIPHTFTVCSVASDMLPPLWSSSSPPTLPAATTEEGVLTSLDRDASAGAVGRNPFHRSPSVNAHRGDLGRHRSPSGGIRRVHTGGHPCDPPKGGMQKCRAAVVRAELDYCWRLGDDGQLARCATGSPGAYSRIYEKVLEVAREHGGVLHAADGDWFSMAWAQRGTDLSAAVQGAAELHWELNLIEDGLERNAVLPARVSHWLGVHQSLCLCGVVGTAARGLAVLGPCTGIAAFLAAAARERGAGVAISGAVKDLCGALLTRRVDVVQLAPSGTNGDMPVQRSDSRPQLHVYQLLTKVEGTQTEHQQQCFNNAFARFIEGDFAQAVDLFERYLIQNEEGESDPVAERFIARGTALKASAGTAQSWVYYASPAALNDHWQPVRTPAWFAGGVSPLGGRCAPLSPNPAGRLLPTLRSPDAAGDSSPSSACPQISVLLTDVEDAADLEATHAQLESPPSGHNLCATSALSLPQAGDGQDDKQQLFRSLVRASRGSFRVPVPSAIVVTAVRASGLMAADTTTSDPYCVLDVSCRVAPPAGVTVQTQVVKGTLEPAWGESFEFELDREQAEGGIAVTATVWDWDMVGSDDFIGFAEVQVSKSQLVGSARTPHEVAVPLGVRPNNQQDLQRFGERPGLGEIVLRVATGSAAARALQQNSKAVASQQLTRSHSLAKRLAKRKEATEKFSTQIQRDADRAVLRTQRTMLLWNTLHLLVLMYNSFFVPVRAVFSEEPTRPEDVGSVHIGQLACDIFLDVSVYYVSIALKFCSPYEEGGRVVTDKALIRWHYLRTWFLWDLLACFPVEVVGMAVDPVAREGGVWMVWFNSWYRVGRLLNLVHLPAYLHLVFDRILTVNPVWGRIWRFLVVVIYATHFVTCLHYAVIEAEYNSGGPALTKEQGETSGNEAYLYMKIADLPNKPVTLRYGLSMDWAVHSLTGYSVKYPISDSQTILSLCVSVAGVFVYAAVIVIISQLVQALSAQEDGFRARLDEIHDVCKHLKLPMHFRHQVVDFYKTLFNTTGACNTGGDLEEQLFSDVPGELRERIESWMNSRIVGKVPMFTRARGEPELMKMLLKELVPQMVTAGHSICTRGEEGHEMYFVIRGECLVVDEDDRTLAEIPSGNYFGEIALFYEVRRTATIRTRTFTQLYVLSDTALERVLIAFPEISAELITAAEQRKPADAKESSLLLFARASWDVIQGGEDELAHTRGSSSRIE
eukprot:TRINITY_DN2423_c0_g1_i1.p1 TRINITY_DN2423_c0_g1~~TRINITY_DN2423_c0_g1_i1.p1  ORF type:complete len:1441 (+),score=287.34 TRINITY_DN2423_c0_g1_i1:505-4323(+)